MAPAPDMFPVRVMVETVRSQHCLGCAHDGNTLVDTFAVVGGQTMLSQLVETVLSALGLPQLVQDSKGMIQINGWKAISFETITDNPEELVTNLFREISTHITLKILAKRSSSEPNGQCITELKHRLLKTAIEKQPQILTTSNGEEVKEILQQVIQGDQQCSTWSSREQADAVNEWLEQMAAVQHHQNDGSGEGGGGGSVNRKSPLCSTRFSPLSELPRLERWFRSDPNPPRQKLLNYMNILNGSPYRRANNKVSYQQICNWFINQRRQRQQQQSSTELQQKQQKQQRQPMAMLPLNATGAMGTIAAAAGTNNNTTNLALLNSLTSALANGTVDAAQIQHKMAAIFAGMGDEFVAQAQKEWAMGENHHDHQIPLANGLPIDIRSKFEHAASIVERENGNGGGGEGTSNQPQQQEGQQSNGEDNIQIMDGGSESPMGNDDMSEHSGISGGGPMDGTRDSAAYSSAEELLFMDIQRQHNNSIGISTNNRPILMVNQQEEHQMPAPTMAVDNEHNMSIDIVGNDHQLHLDQNAATTAAIKLSQLFQNGQQTPPPPNSSVAMAAAAAAFQTLMPTQTQLHLMNHLAMASQFQQQQCLSPGTPQPPPGTNFGSGSSSSLGGGSGAGPSSSAIKSSPSSNSLSGLGRDRERAESAGGSGNGDFSSPSHGNGSNSRQNDGSGNGQSRSRLMFDPLSELPILERWFEENPHPGWLQIEQYTDFLNSMSYRQNYPPISTHNVKIWFKNRRAKTKRLLGNSDGLT